MSPFELALLGYLRSFHAALVAALDDEMIRERFRTLHYQASRLERGQNWPPFVLNDLPEASPQERHDFLNGFTAGTHDLLLLASASSDFLKGWHERSELSHLVETIQQREAGP